MSSLDQFAEIVKRDESLAPYTWLKLGGPAQYFIEPRDVDELVRVVRVCCDQAIPVRVLGGGSNLIVRDEGVSGAVLRLSHPCFAEVHIEGNRAVAGGGALLSHVISEHGNAGGRHGEISQYVRKVTVLTASGEKLVRSEDELLFDYRQSNFDELLILDAEFELQPDAQDEILQRLRKIWITKKASQPLSSQTAGCVFKNPRGQRAGQLIEQAGLKGTRIGGAEINDRHANFIVTHDGASSSDVLRLMDLVRSKVADQFAVHLEPEVKIW
jgi:UDP-N-acetylmuramate dehydrogenase